MIHEPTDGAAVLRLAELGDGVQRVFSAYAAAGHRRPLIALAEVLATSPPARTMPDVVLGVRERPEPLLVFAGEIDEAARARLADLGGLLAEAATRLFILTWPDVEQACERLAEQLLHHLTAEDLSTCVIVGVPRGGLIVASLLAYTLGVPRDRVQPPSSVTTAATTTVVVDDCALSGLRLREFLTGTSAQRIAVATLCSHPDLRAAVQTEDRVITCVAGIDLRDHTSTLLGDDAAAWRARATERVPGRYHAALLDFPVFPWSEPQVRLYNEATGEVEPHWWLGPAGACLEHRTVAQAMAVQVADDRPGIERLRGSVVPVTRSPDEVVLIDAARNDAVTLAGVALDLWTVWMADGRKAAVAKIADEYGQPIARVAADLDDLLASLADRDLLAPDRRQ